MPPRPVHFCCPVVYKKTTKFPTTVHPALLTILIIAAITPLPALGGFHDSFQDSTLRVDFVLSGNPDGSNISVSFQDRTLTSGWGGRRSHLAERLREGAADAVMVCDRTGDTIYSQPFCTLFQEWLVAGDTVGPAAMEGTVLLPYPREKATLTVTLRDNRRNAIARSALRIDPADILIADLTRRRPLPHTYIYKGDMPDSAKIHVAILADGYRREEMPRFLEHARDAVDAILDHEPFASFAEHFDFIAIESESQSSGVAVPVRGKWPATAFGSHFSTFYSDRYLTSPRVHAIYDAITGTPCQHIIVLANTDTYGGGGIFNFYTLTAAGNEKFREVVVHEFGHSFAGLADEYYYDTDDFASESYPLDIEPWEPNITTLVNFASKWQPMVESGDATLTEGGGYRAKGIWRSAKECRMRSNSAPEFCPACREAIREIILWLSGD